MPCNNKKDLRGLYASMRMRFFPDFSVPTCLNWKVEDGPERQRLSRFYAVYLWETLEDFWRNVAIKGVEDRSTIACCCFMPMRMHDNRYKPWGTSRLFAAADYLGDLLKIRATRLGWTAHVTPKIGELHFVMGHWSLGLVAHEVCAHAIFHVIRYIGPSAAAVDAQAKGPQYAWGAAEEDISHLSGALFGDVFTWLCDCDPARRPKMTEWELP